jgi:hypothetical protein
VGGIRLKVHPNDISKAKEIITSLEDPSPLSIV